MATKRKQIEQPKGVFTLRFLQGKEFELENFEWLDFLKKAARLKNETILERVTELSLAYKDPKVWIVTRSFYTKDEAEALNKQRNAKEGDANYTAPNQQKDSFHTSVPLYGGEYEGKYTLLAPQIHRSVDKEEYLIGDMVYEVESFTKDDHVAWLEFSEEHHLMALEAKRSKALIAIINLAPTDEEMDGLRREVPQITASRNALIDRYNTLLLDENIPLTTVENILGRRQLADARLKEVQGQLKAYESGIDTEELANDIGPMQKAYREAEEAVWRVYMGYVHIFADREGLVTETFDDWYARMDEQSKANGAGWVAAGNARRMSGKVARPLTHQEKLNRELRQLNN